MLYINHRINTVKQLAEVPTQNGVEIDLRPQDDRIILHHDPFCEGEDFEDWLKSFKQSLIILNTKAEGMETRLLEIMEQYQVPDFFFLDLSIPFMIKQIKAGVKKIAVRYSEWEPMELVQNFAGKVEWVWVDCFTHLPLDTDNYKRLKDHFKICLVSPELQAHPLEWIEKFKEQIQGMEIDAVCTKRPELWG